MGQWGNLGDKSQGVDGQAALCYGGRLQDDGLDLICRVHMLEIIELRSMGWQTNENVTNYYKQKLSQIDAPPSRLQTAPVQLNPAAPDFNPGGKDGSTPTSNLRKQPELPTAAPRALT